MWIIPWMNWTFKLLLIDKFVQNWCYFSVSTKQWSRVFFVMSHRCIFVLAALICIKKLRYILYHRRFVMKYQLAYTPVTGLYTTEPDRLVSAVLATVLWFIHTLRWRHNGYDSVSNHQCLYCLLNLSYGHRSKKTSKRRVTGLCGPRWIPRTNGQ